MEESGAYKSFRRKCFHHERELVEEKEETQQISERIVVLPEAIIHNEILTRLPTKHLLPCRLVSKSWNSLLFSDPVFVKSHLTRQHSCSLQQEEDVFIIDKDIGIYIISRTQQTLVPFVPKLNTLLLGSINGLVCFSHNHGKQEFCLWNPAIAQLNTFYLDPSHHPKNYCKHSIAGFCWDAVRNDYKVVLVCYDCKTLLPRRNFLVYSSNSATWTQVPLISTHSGLPHGSLFGPTFSTPPCTLVKGVPYWTYKHYLHLHGKKLRRKFISTFKFVAEYNEFRLLPDLDTMKIRGKHFNIVNIKDCLFGMAYKTACQESLVDVYSLDEESPSGVWSKMYTIGPIELTCRSYRLSQCFKNGSEILIFKSPKLCFYDPQTKETKHIKGSNPEIHSAKRVYNYTPSLVRVPGMELMKQELSMYQRLWHR